MKNFDDWNAQKKDLDSLKRDILFKEGEIWWCAVGLNIGSEVYGKGKDFQRPVLILKKLTRDSCIVLPITTQSKDGTWYHHLQIHGENRWVMMHQIRIISSNRLSKRQTSLFVGQFEQLKKSVAFLLGLL